MNSFFASYHFTFARTAHDGSVLVRDRGITDPVLTVSSVEPIVRSV